MKFKNIHGFSLMEMMVVLLIIAVVMAATAPMITRKMISATDSPWVWVGNSGSIGYNLGNAPVTASIGTLASSTNSPRLFVSSNTPNTNPQIRINSPVGSSPTSVDISYLNKSIFISNSSNSSATESVAIGQGSTLGAKSTLALGTYAQASGTGSIAIGSGSAASSGGGSGGGSNADPKGGSSDPKGNTVPINSTPASRTLASQANSIAIGFDSSAASQNAIAIGAKSAANGTLPMALGYNSQASGILSTALGHNTIANKNYSIAIGSGNTDANTQPAKATATYGIAIGVNSTASGAGGVTVGFNSTASDADASAFGMKARATGDGSTAIGYASTASGNYSTALGQGTEANGFYAIAIGGGNSTMHAKANGSCISIGAGASSTGGSSIAIGGATASSNTEALGQLSLAIGAGATSNATSAVAIGADAYASGLLSLAIGGGLKQLYPNSEPRATSTAAMAIGASTNANEPYSMAIGPGASATNENSAAIGARAQTSYANQIVLGDANTTVYIPGNLVVAKKIAVADVYKKVSGRYYAVTPNYGGVSQQESWFYSDRRLKNIGDAYKAGLDELKKLNFYHYTFKSDESKTPRVGVIAQDLQKIFPDAVIKGEDGFLMIRWEDMFYAVINAVKELDQRLTALSEQVKVNIASTVNLQERVAVLEKEITELKKQNEFFVKQNAELEKRLTRLEKHCQ